MKKFRISVSWQQSGEVEIEADNFKEALETLKNLPFNKYPENAHNVIGSYRTDEKHSELLASQDYPDEYGVFGVFVYHRDTEEILEGHIYHYRDTEEILEGHIYHYHHLQDALDKAKEIKELHEGLKERSGKDRYFVQVWKQDSEGLYGNTGEPIFDTF